MAYKYDIFISYRRDNLTRRWIETHFVPLLEHHINLELGRKPIIYIDTLLENGTTWPIALGSALGASRTIIPLWTKTFLNSEWCSCEIGHMLERENKNGYRTIEKPGGLVFPTVIHDGETMPISLTTIQKIEIQECYNVRMSVDSPKAEILDDRLRPLGRDITDAISNAPAWKQDWQIDAVNSFVQQFHIKEESIQSQPPKFSN
jgi:hypothetical protein